MKEAPGIWRMIDPNIIRVILQLQIFLTHARPETISSNQGYQRRKAGWLATDVAEIVMGEQDRKYGCQHLVIGSGLVIITQ